jgi:hypothetical protein
MTLRIQKSVDSEKTVFTLTGRMELAQIPELLTLFWSESRLRGIVLDLTEVRLVDRDAVLFLAMSEARGAELRNCSAYIRKWIDQERSARRGESEEREESEG